MDNAVPGGTVSPTIHGVYGASQSNTLSITRGLLGGGGNIDDQTGNNVVVSGTQYFVSAARVTTT